jgi:hypothetical protein
MSKKPVDRQPDEKPTRRGAGTYDPSNPEPRRMPEDLQEREGFDKPAGRPIDKRIPTPEARGKGKDLFDNERSDWESGRPVQLEDDEDGERSDREAGRPVQLEGDEAPLGQRRRRRDRGPSEVEPTKR